MLDCTFTYITPIHIVIFLGIIMSCGYMVYERRQAAYVPKFPFALLVLITCVILLAFIYVRSGDYYKGLSYTVSTVCTVCTKDADSAGCIQLTKDKQKIDSDRLNAKLTYETSHVCAPYMTYSVFQRIAPFWR